MSKYTELSELIWKLRKISTREKLVLLALAWKLETEKTDIVGQKELMRMCNIARETVIKTIGSLELKGFLRRTSRWHDHGGQAESRYEIKAKKIARRISK